MLAFIGAPVISSNTVMFNDVTLVVPPHVVKPLEITETVETLVPAYVELVSENAQVAL